MNALQEATIETIKKLPDNCTMEDIMYEIDFVAQVYDGLEDAKNGRLISADELLRRVQTWGK